MILLVMNILFFAMAANAKDGLYMQVYADDKSKIVCNDVEKILSNPANRDFGDFENAWHGKLEIFTSQFKINKEYRHSYQWINWQAIDSKDIPEYINDVGIANEILASKGTIFEDSKPYKLQKAVIRFPTASIEKTMPIEMVRIVSVSGSPRGNQRCYIPTKSQTFFSPEFLTLFNGKGANKNADGVDQLYSWCNFLQHENHVYLISWQNRGGSLGVSELIYHNKKFDNKTICSFETDNAYFKY